MIRLKNISLSFEDKTVFKDFSFDFPRKGLVLVTGDSGSGKTSLIKIILGIIKADDGRVDVDCKKISAVFQEDRLVPTLTALQNIELVASKDDALNRLKQVNLFDSRFKFPSELSGGMKRRVALARALAYGGDVLVLDEAFTGIEDDLAKDIISQIYEEFKDKLIIAVTHRTELFSSVNHEICKIQPLF